MMQGFRLVSMVIHRANSGGNAQSYAMTLCELNPD
jgi:hypothetical protein